MPLFYCNKVMARTLKKELNKKNYPKQDPEFPKLLQKRFNMLLNGNLCEVSLDEFQSSPVALNETSTPVHYYLSRHGSREYRSMMLESRRIGFASFKMSELKKDWTMIDLKTRNEVSISIHIPNEILVTPTFANWLVRTSVI